jgi:hypothetical protein
MQRAGRSGRVAGSVETAMKQGAGDIAALRERLIAQLPETLRQQVVNVVLKPGELVVFTESAAWAARLKLAIAETPPVLLPELQIADRITVRLMPTGKFRR